METITLELRPRLRSLSAYIYLSKNVEASAIKVKLLENAIELKIEGELYILPLSSIKLLPTSLSSLSLANHWISFRIQIQPNSIYGTIKTEVIETNSEINNGFSKFQKLFNLLPKNTSCNVLCTCCKNEFIKNISFVRILELPSNDCDPQEWFCCQHNGEKKISLEPNISDLFYTGNYCLINKHFHNDNIKINNKLLHCGRCLSILGSVLDKNPNSLRFWNCCVEYLILNSKSIVKIIPDPLSDFILTVKNIADLVIGEKILLEAYDGNKIHYIILRPMESKLNCLIGNKSSNSNILNVQSSVVSKVLYKCGESKSTLENNDPELKYCELALQSILAGMDHLVTSTRRYPPAYRKAEDFFIGYLSTY